MVGKVSPTRIYEACFVEMGKTLRMSQFYPIAHPAFQRSLERSYLYLSQLLKRAGAFDLIVSKNSLSVDNTRITGNTQVLAFLADEMFRRRIKRLHFDPATELKDYHALFRVLSTEPMDLHAKGGAEKILAQSGARSIWANDLKFQATQITEWEEEEPEQPEADTAEEANSERSDMADLLNAGSAQHPELHQNLENLVQSGAHPKKFAHFLNLIVQYCKEHAAAGDHVPAASSLLILSRLTYQFGDADKQMEWLIKAIRSIATKEVVKVEVSRITHALGNAWQDHANALIPVGNAVIPFLFQALAETDSRKGRQRLIAALHLFGDDIKEPALKLLEDSRWYVLRNAIDLLGGLKDQGVVEQMTEFLKHDHDKVRMATREALRRIGGEDAMHGLIDATGHGEDADRRHAVSQLMFFPAQDVLPKVLELIDKGSAVVADEGLRVLSELDPPDMMPFLQKILANRKGFFGSKKRERLRRTAAELVCLRIPDGWPVLREYASDPDMEIRKWVAKGVELMQRDKQKTVFGY